MKVIPPVVAVDEANERIEAGVVVPRPSLELVLSQKRLELFCVIAPPVVINGIDPDVRPEIANVVVVALVNTPLVEKKLVLVALVEVERKKFAPVAKRLVEDAVVEKKLVVVALVITVEEASKVPVSERVLIPDL